MRWGGYEILITKKGFSWLAELIKQIYTPQQRPAPAISILRPFNARRRPAARRARRGSAQRYLHVILAQASEQWCRGPSAAASVEPHTSCIMQRTQAPYLRPTIRYSRAAHTTQLLQPQVRLPCLLCETNMRFAKAP
eukprot:scaffold16924_cov120-Isochrysis_galbana.AAC.1